MFVELDESKSDYVTFGDASKIPFKGNGKILIHLKNRRHQFILNLYFVPSMKNNILSLGQLLKKGNDIHMKNQSLQIRYKHANLIANVPMTRNKTFLLNIHNDIVKCLNLVSMILLGFDT